MEIWQERVAADTVRNRCKEAGYSHSEMIRQCTIVHETSPVQEPEAEVRSAELLPGHSRNLLSRAENTAIQKKIMAMKNTLRGRKEMFKCHQ